MTHLVINTSFLHVWYRWLHKTRIGLRGWYGLSTIGLIRIRIWKHVYVLYIRSIEMCLSISKNEVNINVLHTAFRKSFTVCSCIWRFLTDQINSKVYLRQNPCRVKRIRSNTCIIFNSLNNTLSCKILYYNMYIV